MRRGTGRKPGRTAPRITSFFTSKRPKPASARHSGSSHSSSPSPSKRAHSVALGSGGSSPTSSAKKGPVVPKGFTNACASEEAWSSMQAFLALDASLPDVGDDPVAREQVGLSSAIVVAVCYRYDTTTLRHSAAITTTKRDTLGYRLIQSLYRHATTLVLSVAPDHAEVSRHYCIPLDAHEGVLCIDKARRSQLVARLLGCARRKIVWDAQAVLQALYWWHEDLMRQPTRNVSDPRIAMWCGEPEAASYEFADVCQSVIKEKPTTRFAVSAVNHVMGDMALVRRLEHTLIPVLRKLELTAVYEGQEMLVVPILASMAEAGLGFDGSVLKAHEAALREKCVQLQAEAERVCGCEIKLNSPKAVAHQLFNVLQLVVPKGVRTDRGRSDQKTVNEAVLTSLRDQHRLPALVLEYRSVRQALSNWVEGLIGDAVPDRLGHARMHTRWLQHATATGRLSSADPNLQNLPKNALTFELHEARVGQLAFGASGVKAEPVGAIGGPGASANTAINVGTAMCSTDALPIAKEVSVSVRDAFIAKPGYVLLAADFSQIEMRILAHMSNDEFLCTFFNQDQDIHRLIAARWRGVEPDEVTKTQRDQAKTVVYGMLYGMGAQALAQRISVKVHEAGAFMRQFLEKFPQVRTFMDRVVADARTNGHVRTMMGRMRHFPDMRSSREAAARAERQALNSTIQGSAADLVKVAMIRSQRELMLSQHWQRDDARLVVQLHDELIWEVRQERVDEMVSLVQRNMGNVVQLRVPLPLHVSVGRSWGTLVDWETKGGSV